MSAAPQNLKSQLLDAADRISRIEDLVGCVSMAAASLARHEGGPIARVLEEAVAEIGDLKEALATVRGAVERAG